MIITLIIALSFPRPDFHLGDGAYTPVGAVSFSGFAIVFLSGAVALNFHYNVPDIIHPVRDKSVLTRIVSGAQAVAFSFCICGYTPLNTHL